MPRKVTKTMREARKRAAKQKRARNTYQAALADRDFNWGGTKSGRFTSSRPNKSNEPSSPTLRNADESVFIPDLNAPKHKASSNAQATVTLDLNKLEERVISQMTEEEYAEREALAQKEIERKKNCIAPAYSKGAYQYIGSAEMAKDAGKKNG